MRTGQVISSSQEELSAARAARKRRLTFIGLLAILMAILSVGGNRSLIKIYRMTKTKGELHREITRLKGMNTQLDREVRSFTNDPQRVEAIAREELGLVKPGEIVYQFARPGPSPTPPRPPRD
jgi:cell division protein FtsB